LAAKPPTTPTQNCLNAFHSERNPDCYRDGAKNHQLKLFFNRLIVFIFIKSIS
jgi:hypothetical protein